MLSTDNAERSVGGRFADRIDDLLTTGIVFEGLKVLVDAVESGDDPFVEEISVSFHVAALAQSPDMQSGPTFFFTFTNELSLEENVGDLKAFVLEQMKLAGIAPIIEERAALGAHPE